MADLNLKYINAITRYRFSDHSDSQYAALCSFKTKLNVVTVRSDSRALHQGMPLNVLGEQSCEGYADVTVRKSNQQGVRV